MNVVLMKIAVRLQCVVVESVQILAKEQQIKLICVVIHVAVIVFVCQNVMKVVEAAQKIVEFVKSQAFVSI
jgi:hypothetical protein